MNIASPRLEELAQQLARLTGEDVETALERAIAERLSRLATVADGERRAALHDLRTPITRLKLRAEFVEDEEQRAKMLADLEELEAMVSATLAFGRDARSTEPVASLDLAELLRTILDETGDAWPDRAEQLAYEAASARDRDPVLAHRPSSKRSHQASIAAPQRST